MKTSNFFITRILILTASAMMTFSIKAQEISVVDVRRNITLSDEDTVYKDYYVNAGDGSALRKNMVVQVKRKINIKDTSAKAVGDFEALVGQLKIIQVGNKVSVAREHKLTPRDEEAMLEQIGIMSGDRLDLTDSFIDNKKPNYNRKTAEAAPAPKAEEIPAKITDAGAIINTETPHE